MKTTAFMGSTDSEGGPSGYRLPDLDVEKIEAFGKARVPGDDDVESVLSLTYLVKEQFEAFGTGGGESVSDEESRTLNQAVKRSLARHGITFDPGWRDFASFRTHWIREGGHGNYQARRDMLEKVFGPIIDQLHDLQDRAFLQELAEPVSPRGSTDWERVDDEVLALRERFRSAQNSADYRDVGNRSVAVLEALSAIVYDDEKHTPAGEDTPVVEKTKIRIGRYATERLGGRDNKDLRSLLNGASGLAHSIKHSPSPDRSEAGIAADAAILLVNIIRRLEGGGGSA
ncbi:hypothetical protein [Brachybacterium sp. p3-SID957]|uniref:hypothetical protein n=1 Tax=Brachybacterium sp. p3-SID957 TaxID=2916049 RepID=UPI00223AFFFA|nr:hypothetical protein [Brachybacterium sp. p3-SID957]MCT1774958.1 hypothetical protein [Brachybacterium sp. p3-SID957]